MAQKKGGQDLVLYLLVWIMDNHEHSEKSAASVAVGEDWLDRRHSWRRPGRLADHKLDANLQCKEAVKSPNAILDSINRTAACGRREAIIPVRTDGSGHMQFYAWSCRLYFKRGTGKFKPVQKSMKRNGRQYLDSIELSLTVLYHWQYQMIIVLKTQPLSTLKSRIKFSMFT